MTKTHSLGITLLRWSLAFVFLWFGFSQISNVAMWTSFVPAWAASIMDPGVLVLMNGLLEIVAGALLAFGIASRWVGLVLGLHLLVISVGLGLTAIGVRDIGLALATLSLFLMAHNELPIGEYF